jgi:hypothetical protein
METLWAGIQRYQGGLAGRGGYCKERKTPACGWAGVYAGGMGSSVSEDFHAHGTDGFGFAVDHATDFFGGLAAVGWFATTFTYSGRDVFYQNGFAVDLKDLTDDFFTKLGVSTYVTRVHFYQVGGLWMAPLG